MMTDRYFRSELEALMYSVREGEPMSVAYVGDGWWSTPRSTEEGAER